MNTAVAQLFDRRDLDVLKTDTPTPLYHQVYVLLKNRILDGSIGHGTQMPTEQELAAIFGVSRITAKRAMDELAEENLVERRRGRGTHVTHHFEPEPVRAPLVGMLEKLVSMGRQTKVKVLLAEKAVPPAIIRAELGLGKGEQAHRVVRVRSSEDGEPFAYYESWTISVDTGFSKRELEQSVRLEAIKANGIKLTRMEQHLGAENVAPNIARELDMQAGDAALTLVRHSYAEDGQLVDILSCHYNPKRFNYRMELGVDDYLS